MSASPKTSSAILAGLAPSDVRIVRDLLTRLGIVRIAAVPDGKSAIAAFARQMPDLIVVAWGDPATNAEEMLAAARTGPDGGPKVVVTMTAPTRDAVDAAKALSVDSIVATPFSPRLFMDRVPRLLAPPQERAAP